MPCECLHLHEGKPSMTHEPMMCRAGQVWNLGFLTKLDLSGSSQLGQVALKAIASLRLLELLLLTACPKVTHHNYHHLSR